MQCPVLQRTLAAEVQISGVGYWSDRDISLSFRPAPPNTGIVFVRDDLPGSPRIPAKPNFRLEIPRRTCLACGDSARVEMIEHVMAALYGMEVDNCEIHVDSAEMPGLDGSALPFVNAFDSVGYEEQEIPAPSATVDVFFQLYDLVRRRGLEIRPNPERSLEISFEIRYPSVTEIGTQTRKVNLTPDVFRQEIAPCRTFLTETEAQSILDAGLARRASYSDLLVFGKNGLIGNELRFPDECVRHKILDLTGDLALFGKRLNASIYALCSGHDLNVRLVDKLLSLYSEKS